MTIIENDYLPSSISVSIEKKPRNCWNKAKTKSAETFTWASVEGWTFIAGDNKI